MKRFLNKNLLYPLALILLSSFIAFQNYTPGTFLSGWDTLHPEFNFPLNISRAFFGVFRFEQGLGAVAGHSHMADLPRILFLFLSSFVLPTDFLRYFYMFLMLIIGPLGMYFFLSKSVIKDKTVSFLGALFYLLNIGTVQIFYVPFEMFVSQYGFLPWLFLFATQYLKDKSKKYLLLFALVTLLSTPIAYAATLWYVQFTALTSYILVFTFQDRTHAIKKRAVALILSTLLINSFWILPNIYFTLNYATSVAAANINKLFSAQAFLYNKEFGNLKDIILMKNFLFDWNIYAGRGNFVQLLSVWNSHLVNLLLLGFLFGFMSLAGTVSGVLKKDKVLISLIPTLFICLFFLINDNFPTGFIYTFMQDTLPLFKEALRFPHGKVLGLFVFCFAIFFAFGLQTLGKVLPKFAKIAGTIIVICSLVWFSLPMFAGNLISPYMRIKIPQEYFSLFSYFDKQANSGKVANLPIHSFWGWEYYNWYPTAGSGQARPSFQGAGFLWFGIKQPLLARDFDRWNPTNEQYYREMSYAIYSQNSQLLASVIKKYDVGYVLIDKSIIAPQASPDILFHDQTDELLNDLVKNDTLEKPLNFGKIEVFKIKSRDITEKFSALSSNTTNIYEDFTFEKYGNYISEIDSSILDNSSVLKSNLFDINSEGILINKQGLSNASMLRVPLINAEKNISAEVTVQKDSSNKLTVSFYPDSFSQTRKVAPIVAQIQLSSKNADNATLSVNQKDNFVLKNLTASPVSLGRLILSTQEANTVSLYDDSQSQEVIPDFSSLKYTLLPCSPVQNENTFGIETDRQSSGFTIFTTDSSICMTIPVSEISKIDPAKSITKDSLVGMRFSYVGSRNSNICAVNLLTGGCIKNIKSEADKIGNRDIGNLGIRITLDASTHRTTPSTPFGAVLKKAVGETKTTYQNIRFIITKPFYTASLDSNVLSSSLSIGADSKQDAILIPFILSDEFSKNIKLVSQPNNACPGADAEDVRKNIKTDHIEYISKKGSYCDYFSYQNLPQNSSYAIVVTSKNVKGLPLTICVSNPYSNHCDLYAALPTDKEKKQTVFILPPMSNDKTGFTIDINNFAINKTPSINNLYSIQVVPFPYSWLTNISAGTQIKDSRIIIYPYSFDKGWKAYEMVSSQWSIVNGLQRALPFLFGRELKNHVKINGWQNGWINNYTLDAKPYTLVIVFLPQYLEYLGFVFLGATFLYLIIMTKQKKGLD